MAAPATDTLTIHVPLKVVTRGGRKQMRLPEGARPPRIDNVLLKALARAFRWKRLIDDGAYATIGDLARHEKMAHSYMTRVLRLTLLAPDIIEAIVDGRSGPEVTLARLLEPFPADWDKQQDLLGQAAAVQSQT